MQESQGTDLNRAIDKVRSLDLAVTVFAEIAQEYVFQESQVIQLLPPSPEIS